MKTLLRVIKNFWFLWLLVWLSGIALGAAVLGWTAVEREAVWVGMALFSACCLLWVVLRQYARIRTERNLEHLLSVEVDREQRGGEFRDHQVLRERLQHAVKLLRAAPEAGGGGTAALSDLPWYLVIGLSASGKTSLLTRAGLSARVAEGSMPGLQSGTQHCDWYFSPEAVMIDTAGRYLSDDQSAHEFTGFLKLLRRQRRRPAINGLVLVVSLPEILSASQVERGVLSAQLVARIHQYSASLGVTPPVYLMLSKTDLLPGFHAVFDGLDAAARQQPLGMTFDPGVLRKQGMRQVLEGKFSALLQRLNQHVGAQVSRSAEGAIERLQFPRYLADMSGVLADFLAPFDCTDSTQAPLLLRGLYFTSALQDGQALPAIHEDELSERYGLAPSGEVIANLAGEKSYFITDVFRKILFPDRELGLYYARQGVNHAWRPVLLTGALLVGAGALAWEASAFHATRLWLTELRDDLDVHQASGADAVATLEMLREQVQRLNTQSEHGMPWARGAGLYPVDALQVPLQAAYKEQLRRQVLAPISRHLQLQLHELNELAKHLTHEPHEVVVPKKGARAAASAVASNVDVERQAALSRAGLALSEEVVGRLNEAQATTLVEAYNALKLYLILTSPQQHPDTDFLSVALPSAWRQVMVPAGSWLSAASVNGNTTLYAQMVRQDDAPVMPRNESLVSAARHSLKSLMITSSLVEREYLRLQLESDQQYPALTLNQMVSGPGRQLLFSAQTVPALYTRQGWEQFMQPALLKLLAGSMQHDSDWVLEGQDVDQQVQKVSVIRDLMALYKRDYAAAWTKFLAGTGLRQFSTLEQALQHLAPLSDVQNSPLKQVLMALHQNTSWDRPSDEPLAEAATAGLAAILPFNDGALSSQFDSVSRLFSAENPDGVDRTVMDRYLAALRKLKVRLSNIERSQDLGKSSKQLIIETLDGQPTEVTNLRNYVESSIETSQGSLSSSLKRLFNDPIMFTWESLRAPAGEQVAKAWSQQIIKPWQQNLAHRYPINPAAQNEASVKDLQRFVDPGTGLMPAFQRNEIGNLAGGEGLGMSRAGNGAPLVSSRMLQGIEKASALGEVIASLSDPGNGFEVMLEPSQRFTDIILTLDGQVQHYRNGKPQWSRFTWPGNPQSPGARLDVVTLTGERKTVFDYPGRWGLLKMNDSAKVSELDQVRQRFTWPVQGAEVSLVLRNYGGVRLTDLGDVKSLGTLGGAARADGT